jgi:electron transfer flavoprotein beta subunit
MNIVVCAKQVPETGDVRIDEKTGTLVREGVENILNPLDLYAVEAALSLRDKFGGSVAVVSMGPRNADKAVREAIAMGCDSGALVSHPAFAGSDTWATSYALSKAIEKLAPYDLIITGERATDGDTGQVGPGIASFLNLPVATYTSRIVQVGRGKITVERLVETGYETLRLRLPCLLTVVKEIAFPRLPTLRGKQRAKKLELPVWGPSDLKVDAKSVGLAGSPTRVVKIERPRVVRKGRSVDVGKIGAKAAAVALADFLQERNLL